MLTPPDGSNDTGSPRSVVKLSREETIGDNIYPSTMWYLIKDFNCVVDNSFSLSGPKAAKAASVGTNAVYGPGKSVQKHE